MQRDLTRSIVVVNYFQTELENLEKPTENLTINAFKEKADQSDEYPTKGMMICPVEKSIVETGKTAQEKSSALIEEAKDLNSPDLKLAAQKEWFIENKILYQLNYCKLKELQITLIKEKEILKTTPENKQEAQKRKIFYLEEGHIKRIDRYLRDLITEIVSLERQIKMAEESNQKENQKERVINEDLKKFKEQADKSNPPINSSFKFLNVGEKDNIYTALKTITSNDNLKNYQFMSRKKVM